jgi:hypothetical protein
MATRSIIAVPQADGWQGRFCESDGHVDWMGRTLWKLVDRHGLQAVRKTLVTGDTYGWAYLNPDQTGPLDRSRSDGRYVRVDGYGVAFTPLHGGATAGTWLLPGDERLYGAEWVYVLADDGLWVQNDDHLPIPAVRWDGQPPDWNHLAVRASW